MLGKPTEPFHVRSLCHREVGGRGLKQAALKPTRLPGTLSEAFPGACVCVRVCRGSLCTVLKLELEQGVLLLQRG